MLTPPLPLFFTSGLGLGVRLMSDEDSDASLRSVVGHKSDDV